MKSELCKSCIHTEVCGLDKNVVGDFYVAPNPWYFSEEYKKESWEKYKEREAAGFPCEHYIKMEKNNESN